MTFTKSWTAGLSKEEADEMRTLLVRAKPVLSRLGYLLDQRITSSERSKLSKDNYDCPNWAYSQADTIGYLRAIREIQDIVKER